MRNDPPRSYKELNLEIINSYLLKEQPYNCVGSVKSEGLGITLLDYIKGEGDFTTDGYPTKSYWSQQDQDKLMDILENGNY